MKSNPGSAVVSGGTMMNDPIYGLDADGSPPAGAVRDPRNHAAWEKFIARYRPMIRGWCHQWFPHEADDKACEVLSELIFRMINFEYDADQGRFRGWLKTVTHNLMARLKKDLLPQADDDHDPIDLAEAGEDLAARLAAEFDLEQLEIARSGCADVCSRIPGGPTWQRPKSVESRPRLPASWA